MKCFTAFYFSTSLHARIEGPASEEACDDANEPEPFFSLFSRISKDSSKGNKRSTSTQPAQNNQAAAKKARPNGAGSVAAPARSAPAAAMSTPNAATPAHANPEKPDNMPPPAVPNKRPRNRLTLDQGIAPTGSGTTEDTTLIESYKLQLESLMRLDVEKSEDSVFMPWSKGRAKTLTELKQAISSKKKSLGRRKGDSTFVVAELDKIIGEIASFIDVLKMLEKGFADGMNLYQSLKDIVPIVGGAESYISNAIWERGLRAVAFEDGDWLIKVIYELLNHLPMHFFELIVSLQPKTFQC